MLIFQKRQNPHNKQLILSDQISVTVMNSLDKASFCDPKNKNGRIIVGGAVMATTDDALCTDISPDTDEKSLMLES